MSWIRHVFGPPGGEKVFLNWNESKDPLRALSFLTQLFEEPAWLIDEYPLSQIDCGLSHLVDPGKSGHMHLLKDEDLPWVQRRRCIHAMIPLFEKLMAPLYGDMSGLQPPRDDPERRYFTCFMWWDVIPLYPEKEHPDFQRINAAAFYVLEQTLRIESNACIESALHGLGHRYFSNPGRTRKIISRFIQRKDVSPKLRLYAELAARGAVL